MMFFKRKTKAKPKLFQLRVSTGTAQKNFADERIQKTAKLHRAASLFAPTFDRGSRKR